MNSDDSESKFQPGDNVKVILGPFAQLTGVVDAVYSSERIHVLITIFGRATPVDFAEKQIVKVV